MPVNTGAPAILNKIITNPIVSVVILVALAGYFFFYQLGALALTDPDETFYAQTSKEMLERGEWLTPYLYGKPQFEKPILFYWLVHASYKVFGVNEFAARFPSALFALIGLIAMYLLGSTLFNRRVGLFAAAILGTNVEYVILARACVTDMVLTVFLLIGIYRFFAGYFEGKRYAYILSGVAFGFAVLTKGPIFIALALGVILLFLVLAKDLAGIRKMPVGWIALAYLAVAVPWYMIAYKLHGTTFVDEFFGFHNITRFVVSEHKIGSQVYYNIPIILGGFFPWSVFLPLGLWRMFRMARSRDEGAAREKRAAIFILTWLAVIFLFFTASSTKLPTYIFPLFISLALIVAVFWDRLIDDAAADVAAGGRKGLLISSYALTAIACAGSVGGIVYTVVDYPAITAGVCVMAALAIPPFILSSAACRRGKHLAAFALIIYAVGILLPPLESLVLPEIERYETSKTIARKLKHFMKPGELLGSESNYLAGLAFYTGTFPVNLDRHHDLWAFLHSPGRIWAVIKGKNHRFLYEATNQPQLDVTTYALYTIGKRTIVTNDLPPGAHPILTREAR